MSSFAQLADPGELFLNIASDIASDILKSVSGYEFKK